MSLPLMSYLPFAIMIVRLAILIYVVIVLGRLVRAVEKIADKIDDSPKI